MKRIVELINPREPKGEEGKEIIRTKTIEVKVSHKAVSKALGLLKNGDKDSLAQVRAALLSSSPPTDVHYSFRVLIAYAITDPGGHIERILREHNFLVPELTAHYKFGEGSH